METHTKMKYLSVTVLRFLCLWHIQHLNEGLSLYYLRLSNVTVTAFNNEDSKFLGNNFYQIRSSIHEVALLLRLKLSTLGIFFVLPCIEKYTKVDLRTSVIDIPPQEVCSDVSIQSREPNGL